MTERTRSLQRLTLVALALGLVLRLAFGLAYWREKPLTHDEQEYLVLAVNLAAGRGFTRELPGALDGPNVQRFSRAPLYPAMLAVVFRATGQPTDRLPSAVPTSVKVCQSVIGVLGIWLIGRLAGRIAGERAAVVAAWLAAVYPPLVWIGAYALSEALYSPLILGSVLLLARALDRRRSASGGASATTWGPVAMGGLLAGTSALVRSSSLVFVPLAAAWLVYTRRSTLALVLAIAAAVPVAPWTLRNLAVHGRPIVVAADGGVTFWTGNHPLARGEGDLAANPDLKIAQRAFLDAHPGLSPEELEPLYYQEGVAYVVSHPIAWLRLAMAKLVYLVVPIGPSYTLHSALYYWSTVVPYLALLPCAVAGWLQAMRREPPPVALTLLAGSVVLIAVIFFPQERFRIPVLDPTYVVFAACWLARRHAARLDFPAA